MSNELLSLTDDQLLLYATSIEAKGRNLRLEITRKRDRIKEIEASPLTLETKKEMLDYTERLYREAIAMEIFSDVSIDQIRMLTQPKEGV